MFPIVGGCGYEPREILTRGTFGNVTRVLKKSDPRKVYAAKTQELGMNGITFSELDLVRRLDHPNIIKAVDLLIPSQVCLVEDFGYVMPLGQPIDALDFRTHVQSYLGDILSGLCYLHDNGILHFDIKGENIVKVDGRICLIDFTVSNQDHLVQPGSYIDKRILSFVPEVSPPETFATSDMIPVSYATDIWAVGMMILRFHGLKVEESYETWATSFDTRQVDKWVKNKPLALLTKLMMDPDPNNRPTARTLLNSRFFGSRDVKVEIYEPEMDVYNVLPDMDVRELMKLQVTLLQNVIPGADVEILFLAMDLFYRYCGLVDNDNYRYQAALVICSNMALYTITFVITNMWEYARVNFNFAISDERIFEVEMDILSKLGGKINVNAVYRKAKSADQLAAGFGLIYFNPDPLILSRMDIDKWTELLDEKMPGEDDKKMKIGEFVVNS